MFLTVLVWLTFMGSAWGQPFANTDAYAASKFFIGTPSVAENEFAKPLDLRNMSEEKHDGNRELLPPSPGAVYENIGFVRGDGIKFSVNGKPYYCSGTNAFYAGLEYIMSETEVIAMVREQKKQGASILRIFTSYFDSVPERYVDRCALLFSTPRQLEYSKGIIHCI